LDRFIGGKEQRTGAMLRSRGNQRFGGKNIVRDGGKRLQLK
jgi:hypothetical protein